MSRSSTFHRFTIYYSEGPVLRRILTAAQHAKAEPAWHFVRLGGRSGFRIDLVIGGLSHDSARGLAIRLEHLPGVTKVMWARRIPASAQSGLGEPWTQEYLRSATG